MTQDFRTGRQWEHLHMPEEEYNRRMGAIAEAFGLNWLSAGNAALQSLWQRKDGFAVNQLCLLGDAIAGFNQIDQKWVGEHVEKLKGADANSSSRLHVRTSWWKSVPSRTAIYCADKA